MFDEINVFIYNVFIYQYMYMITFQTYNYHSNIK